MNIKLSILLLSLTIATTLLSANGNNTIKSFSTAKKILKKQIYNNDKLESHLQILTKAANLIL